MDREVTRVVESKEVPEGNGAKVRRTIGRGHVVTLDPFLLLDEVRIQYPAGFPDHPHRGFETVTYNLKGKFRHEDCEGNSGVLEAGDLQWMTAGRGVLHSEVPIGDEESHGLQLWINLASRDKMVPPSYQNLKSSEIPTKTVDGVTVKVVAGESMGVTSMTKTRTPTYYLHFKAAPGTEFLQTLPEDWTCFCYVIDGERTFGSTKPTSVISHSLAVFSTGSQLKFRNESSEILSFILVAGQPLNEPVARQGPFVMNTYQQLEETYEDYQKGRNGFEKAKNWVSEYGSKTIFRS